MQFLLLVIALLFSSLSYATQANIAFLSETSLQPATSLTTDVYKDQSVKTIKFRVRNNMSHPLGFNEMHIKSQNGGVASIDASTPNACTFYKRDGHAAQTIPSTMNCVVALRITTPLNATRYTGTFLVEDEWGVSHAFAITVTRTQHTQGHIQITNAQHQIVSQLAIAPGDTGTLTVTNAGESSIEGFNLVLPATPINTYFSQSSCLNTQRLAAGQSCTLKYAVHLPHARTDDGTYNLQITSNTAKNQPVFPITITSANYIIQRKMPQQMYLNGPNATKTLSFLITNASAQSITGLSLTPAYNPTGGASYQNVTVNTAMTTCVAGQTLAPQAACDLGLTVVQNDLYTTQAITPKVCANDQGKIKCIIPDSNNSIQLQSHAALVPYAFLQAVMRTSSQAGILPFQLSDSTYGTFIVSPNLSSPSSGTDYCGLTASPDGATIYAVNADSVQTGILLLNRQSQQVTKFIRLPNAQSTGGISWYCGVPR